EAAGGAVSGLIYTSDASFPRTRAFVARLAAALEAAARGHETARCGGVLWLRAADPVTVAPDPFGIADLEVECRSHRRRGGGLTDGRQAQQLFGGAEQRVVVEQGARRRTCRGARADHDRRDVAAAVGRVRRARLAALAAGAFVPGDEHGGGAAGVRGGAEDG